eukprot:Clim_evm88s144 gene=Clim_evmTU88s144
MLPTGRVLLRRAAVTSGRSIARARFGYATQQASSTTLYNKVLPGLFAVGVGSLVLFKTVGNGPAHSKGLLTESSKRHSDSLKSVVRSQKNDDHVDKLVSKSMQDSGMEQVGPKDEKHTGSEEQPDEHVAKLRTAPAWNKRPDLPTYDMDELKKHTGPSSASGRTWVAFGHGVYDMTEFVENHPGGNKILLAAGGSVEPWWQVYHVHAEMEVFELIEEHRIGNLHESARKQFDEELKKSASAGGDDPVYGHEPKRHIALAVKSAKPFNAETPGELLADKFITPNDLFYVRNHLPVPVIDAEKYELKISTDVAGHEEGSESASLSLQHLKDSLPKVAVVAVIQCGGNRRADMSQEKKVQGLSWQTGAIGNAKWAGASLKSLLESRGITYEYCKKNNLLHAQFHGLDSDEAGQTYGASIPVSKIFDPDGGVLLAYEMNGKPLPVDHGAPVRVVVPGSVGARSVKWLGKIKLTQDEVDSQWQKRDYKIMPPHVDFSNVNWDSVPAIQAMPVQSAICEPQEGDTVYVSQDDNEANFVLRGYAFSGGGNGIQRVDVSLDGGKTWEVAELSTEADEMEARDIPSKDYAWATWRYDASLKAKNGEEIKAVIRAVDTSGNMQPERAAWNFRGLLNNSWHSIHIKVKELREEQERED